MQLHIQIRFPGVIHLTGKVFDEGNVRRSFRINFKGHFRFFGSPVAFLIIAFYAGRNEVFPCIFATARSRHNMIYGKIWACSTILASMSIPAKNILSGENDLFERYFYEKNKTYYTGIIKCLINCLDNSGVIIAYDFGFTEVCEDKSPPYVTNCKGLIVLI